MRLLRLSVLVLAVSIAGNVGRTGWAQAQIEKPETITEKVLIDTDIGDDIDDAFAVGLMLSSPNVRIVGIESAWGDTTLRSRMIDRLLCETGRQGIEVATGVEKTGPGAAQFSQRAWAEEGIVHAHPDAVSFLLDQIRKNPGELTLLALAPLTNLGTAIDRDPSTFGKLKRIVMMGGSIHRGYDDSLGFAPSPPVAEYNIAMDPQAAQKVFRSGVPIVMLPLDSTQVKLDETRRSLLASISTPLTDSLQILTAENIRNTLQPTPTLFDGVAAAYVLHPASCPTTPLRIEVDTPGLTHVIAGRPNAEVCLEQHSESFFDVLLPALLHQRLIGTTSCITSKR